WTFRETIGLSGLDLELKRGQVLGYLGPNGAGKTTTLKLLAGLMKPTRGQAWLFGDSIEDPASRRHLGFLPEQPYFYDYLNGIEYLRMAGQLSGLGAHEAHTQATHWLGRVGLGGRAGLKLRKYSKGMLQRLGLAAALAHRPRLLILDEPMSGLDPFGRRDVRDLILEQKAAGVTVLFSSHILPDVELLCDRVAMLSGGQLARVATVDQLTREAAQHVEIVCRVSPRSELPAPWRASIKHEKRGRGAVMLLDHEDMLGEVLGWLLRSGARITSVTPQRPSLEQLLLSAAEDFSTTDRIVSMHEQRRSA
ncbi:MAG: ABC transporter ATP-binding protein, partial [Candidatus Eiseniibacteriota bacterium]